MIGRLTVREPAESEKSCSANRALRCALPQSRCLTMHEKCAQRSGHACGRLSERELCRVRASKPSGATRPRSRMAVRLAARTCRALQQLPAQEHRRPFATILVESHVHLAQRVHTGISAAQVSDTRAGISQGLASCPDRVLVSERRSVERSSVIDDKEHYATKRPLGRFVTGLEQPHTSRHGPSERYLLGAASV